MIQITFIKRRNCTKHLQYSMKCCWNLAMKVSWNITGEVPAILKCPSQNLSEYCVKDFCNIQWNFLAILTTNVLVIFKKVWKKYFLYFSKKHKKRDLKFFFVFIQMVAYMLNFFVIRFLLRFLPRSSQVTYWFLT